MVMDHGRIIERGNHASLMAERGTYYRLYLPVDLKLIKKKDLSVSLPGFLPYFFK